MTTELTIPDVTEDKQAGSALVASVKTLSVVDADSYSFAAGLGVDISGRIKVIEAKFKPIKQAHDAAKQKILDLEHELVDPLKEAKGIVSDKALNWQNEQRRKAEEEERRQREEARKKAEQEQLEAAMLAEAEGDKETAEAIIQEPVYVPPVQVKAEIPKVSGFSVREQWTFEVVDEKKIPREYLILDEVKVGKIVRAMKGSTNIPGIRAYNATGASMRTK